MPSQSLTLLKAGRIVEAQQRVQSAKQELDAAQAAANNAATALAAAHAALERAVGDADKQAAAATVQTANEQLTAAQVRLAEAQQLADFEQAQLEQLLSIRSPFPLTAILQYAIFGLLALTVLVFLIWGIANRGLLPQLSTIATARGLITFLITVVTVTIALVLMLATVISESPDRMQRFLNGKDLLTALIGVLGTIVGYYFGQNSDAAKGVSIDTVYVSAESLQPGESANLVAFVSGGKPHYTYDIEFTPNQIPGISNKQSADGQIAMKFTAISVEKDTEVSFIIRVRDGAGAESTYDSAKAGKKLVIKKPPDQQEKDGKKGDTNG